jgi:DNA adenine methylase
MVPKDYGTYYEPFAGAGAVFFALNPRLAVIADANERLIRTYRAIRDNVASVIQLLEGYPNEKQFYLQERGRDIDTESDAEVAAWMIYLNRTGYNGLYRVNRQGKFNVPFGRYERPRICDPENLRACAAALRGAKTLISDFEVVTEQAQPGDFVYFDPPYVAVSTYSDFTRYTSAGFRFEDQVRLRDTAARLKSNGVSVLISNSDAPDIRTLYGHGFRVKEVQATRLVNCRAAGRGKIAELLIS